MSQHIPSPQPLFLTEEETLALLNMCLVSPVQTTPEAECAIQKLANLARRLSAMPAAVQEALPSLDGEALSGIPETGISGEAARIQLLIRAETQTLGAYSCYRGRLNRFLSRFTMPQ
ncbi:MAG TPA: hypothetical protein VFB38_12950 [Chthonomonadaceae bacterium]|nr:hypothetical protein [Chthonomonadaceae bacterium]